MQKIPDLQYYKSLLCKLAYYSHSSGNMCLLFQPRGWQQ